MSVILRMWYIGMSHKGKTCRIAVSEGKAEEKASIWDVNSSRTRQAISGDPRKGMT